MEALFVCLSLLKKKQHLCRTLIETFGACKNENESKSWNLHCIDNNYLRNDAAVAVAALNGSEEGKDEGEKKRTCTHTHFAAIVNEK